MTATTALQEIVGPLFSPGVLAVPQFDPEHVVHIDYETFWDDKYNLDRYTTSDYVMDPRFEVLGVGVKIDAAETVWMEEPEFRTWAASWDWRKTALCAHHAHFDGLISSMRYQFAPGFWFDTLSMSRALDLPGGLEELGPLFGVGEKGTELLSSKGKHRGDFTPDEWAAFGLYCCLRRDVPVEMADGTTKTISELVEKRSTEKVMSYNEGTRKLEPRSIVGWHRARVKDQKWVRIKTTKLRGMVVTPEHRVLVEGRGWIRADEVIRGDQLLLVEEQLNADRRSALMGTLLGDSTISVAPSYRGKDSAPFAIVSGVHESRSLLAQEKVRLLGSIASLGTQLGAHTINISGRKGLACPAQRWSTRSFAQFALWRKTLHPGGSKKRLPLDFVKEMGPIGWAWWFMDDGCVQKRKSRSRGKQKNTTRVLRESLCLCTQGFPREDVQIVVEWFRERFGPTIAGKDNVIRIGAKASEKFCLEIAPFVFPEQRYKLPKGVQWPEYRDFDQADTHEPVRVSVLEAEAWEPPRSTNAQRMSADTRYCIDVEGNHNFFTSNGLVHNCNDVDLMAGILGGMGDFPEPELWVIDMTVRMFTEPQLVVDEKQLREFVEYEKDRKEKMLQRVGLTRKDVGSNKRLKAAFEALGVEVPMKVSPTSKKRNSDGSRIQVEAFAKTDAGMQELLEHEDEDVRALAEVRIAVKSGQAESRGERYLRMGAGGRPLPVYLKYFGAHTGRWTASDKTQFHNLEKTSKKDPKKGMLKKSLCAIPSRKVVAADSGAIEARKTAWLAGHAELVAGFARNEDVYSKFASIAYGREIDRKKNVEDEAPGFLGKVCILGLGFGMGWPKLAVTLLRGAMGNPPVTLTEHDAQTMGVDLDKFCADETKVAKIQKMVTRLPIEELAVHCACCEKLVQTYRKANKPIVQLWQTMEKVLEAMVELSEGEQISFGPNDCLTIVRNGIILPNGLMLHYPELRKSKRVNEDGEETWGSNYSYRGKFVRQHVYGGLLTENVVQALARIVVSEQMLSVRAKYGYEPVTITHDEVVVIVDDAEAPLAEYRLVEEMKVTPVWAKGLPLTAEGGHAQTYGAA